MPVYTAQHTLNDSTTVRICPPDVMPQRVSIHNAQHSESADIYIGNETVTTTTGIHLHTAVNQDLILGPNDTLWAISNTATPVVHVIRITED